MRKERSTDATPEPVIWRPPFLAEAVAEIARLTGAELSVLTEQEALEALDLALDGADLLDPTVHRSQADRAAAMCAALLQPGLVREGPRVAAALLTTTAARSGAAWTLDAISTALYLRAWQRRPGPLEALSEWTARHLVRLHPDHPTRVELRRALKPRDVPLRYENLLPASADPRHLGIFISGPVANLADPEVNVEMTRCQIAAGIDVALATLPLAAPVRVLYPSELVVSPEQDDRSDRAWLELVAEMLLGSDAYIVTDVNQRAPGFGAAVEALSHAAMWGPSLILMHEDCPGASRFEGALVPELRATFADYATADEQSLVVAEWVVANFEELMAARRRKINARLLNARRAAELQSLVKRSSRNQLTTAQIRTGVPLHFARQVIERPELALSAPFRQVEDVRRFLLALHRRDERVREASRQRSAAPIDVTALERAARSQGWSTEHVAYLLSTAEREYAAAGAQHRLKLLTEAEWIAFDERLRRR